MNNYYSATLGKVLKDWHESQNLTMYAIAKTLQANRQPLDELEAGKSSAPENTLRYLVWAAKRNPQIWQTYLAALDRATSEEEQQRILEYQEQAQKNKDKAEAARRAKEAEAAKAAVRAEVTAEVADVITTLRADLAAQQQAVAAATQRAVAAEADAKKNAEKASSTLAQAAADIKALTDAAAHQQEELEKLREENNRLQEHASAMRKAPWWRRVMGKF